MSAGKVLTRTSKSASGSTLELKNELLKWICERHATNGPLDRKRLRDKAMELATSLGILGFKCSESWLTIFLKKNGFCPSLTSCEGPKFADFRKWIELMRPVISQYRHKDLFIVDELVMYSNYLPWRMREGTERPDEILHNQNDAIRLGPENKKIRILLCCNSRGTEKLEPLISNASLSCENPDEDECYISDEDFGNWLEKFERRMTNCDRNVLLVLSRDRIRSLRNVRSSSNVKMLFLPRDFPASLLPLRGDVFHCLKMVYRSRYVEFIQQVGSSLNGEWTSKRIVETIFEAWMDIPRELIVSSFQRTKFREDESFLKIHCSDWDRLQTGMSFRKYVTFDDDLTDTCRAFDRRFSSAETRYNLRKSEIPTVQLNDGSLSLVEAVYEEKRDDSSRERDSGTTDSTRRANTPIVRIDRNFGKAGNPDEHDRETGGSPGRDYEEVNWRLGESDSSVANFPGEAGPSGRASRGSQGTPRGSAGSVRDDELRLKILNAIEMCAETSTSDDGQNATFKRPPSKQSPEDEPLQKLPKSEDWSRCYEKSFVFGPETTTASPDVSDTFPTSPTDQSPGRNSLKAKSPRD